MSGVGKSTLVRELRRRGLRAYDADDDGFSEPRADGRWGWWVERVADVLKQGEAAPDLVFFAGCSEEQATLPFDYRVLLTAPAEILVQRLMARTTNAYGRSGEQRAQVLADQLGLPAGATQAEADPIGDVGCDIEYGGR